MITIEVDDKRVLDVIDKLLARLGDLTPIMQTIGERLIRSTKERFVTSTSPEGVRWVPNTETTYLRMIERAHGVTLTGGKNAGRINAKGVGIAASKKPLIGETHRLESEFSVQAGPDSVTIGSSLVYAATQQFGAAQGAFGHDRRNHPIPWGRIPPRPFLGVSEADADQVLAIVGEHLASVAE